MRSILVALMAFSLGCSVDHDVSEEQKDEVGTADEVVSAEAMAVDDQLPDVTILRVPLDADGKELAQGIEMRTVASGQRLVDRDAAAISQAFANGSATREAVIDELDSDSSAQSWSFTQTQPFGSPNQDGFPGQDPGQFPGQGQGQFPGQDQFPGQGQGQFPGQGQNQFPQQDQFPSQDQFPGQGQSQFPGQGGYEVPGTVQHIPGTQRSIFPVKRKTIVQHNTTNVYPREKIDIYPVENVRIHPTQRSVQVHPVQRHLQYVNSCVSTGCNGARFSNYWPTVTAQGHNQFYHYTNHFNRGGYRYYMYCKPRFFINSFAARRGYQGYW